MQSHLTICVNLSGVSRNQRLAGLVKFISKVLYFRRYCTFSIHVIENVLAIQIKTTEGRFIRRISVVSNAIQPIDN